MDRLLSEILDHIFLYCSVKDKLNVACCNKAHCSLLKPWLWGCVAVPVFEIEELTHPLENLKHTSMLKIDGTLDHVHRSIPALSFHFSLCFRPFHHDFSTHLDNSTCFFGYRVALSRIFIFSTDYSHFDQFIKFYVQDITFYKLTMFED